MNIIILYYIIFLIILNLCFFILALNNIYIFNDKYLNFKKINKALLKLNNIINKNIYYL